MRAYLDLGATPCDETCAQVGTEDYAERARKECSAYIGQLRRMFPEVPGSMFARKSNPHDYGSYYSVVVYYDTDQEDSIRFAFHVESNLPGTWDDTARTELGI